MLLRPLLGWRKAELAAIVERAGFTAADDPSNANPRFDRARIRAALAEAEWLDPSAIARSAAHLEEAENALSWAVLREWEENVAEEDGAYIWEPASIPRAMRIRVIEMGIAMMGGQDLRGGAVARIADDLVGGGRANLGGVLVEVTKGVWRFSAEPPRRG